MHSEVASNLLRLKEMKKESGNGWKIMQDKRKEWRKTERNGMGKKRKLSGKESQR